MLNIKVTIILISLLLTACVFEVSNKERNTRKDFEKEEKETIESVELESETSDQEQENISENEKDSSSQNKPKTVKDYFMLLPDKYFTIECCQGNKQEYLKTYLTVEDAKNGYLEGGGDGAQSTFKMALFKRPDKSYIIALNVFGEAQDDYYFLNYQNGNWTDISAKVIPEYNKMKIYEIPRFGNTMPVFAKKVIDSDGENDLTEKGEKLYNLIWKNGKFSIKK